MKVDYFKGISTIAELYTTKIEVEEKIHDEMPKYAESFRSVNWLEFSVESRVDGFSKEFRLREAFSEMGMFGFVSWRWINPFAEWIGKRKCLEVMAGRGWLSHGLQTKGVDVIATDNFSWHEGRFQSWNNTVSDVEKLDAVESVEKYGEEIDLMIMSWAYMDDVAYKTIKKLHEVNPDALIVFIGEWRGCTANDDFFEHFETIDDEGFDENVASMYQSWEGLHDRMYLGKWRD